MVGPSSKPLHRNVKLLGWISLLTDVASEMIYPLLPQFLITVLGGNRFQLGLIEGVADAVSSLLKLASGAWSDRTQNRKRFVVFGYSLAGLVRPLVGLAMAPWHVLLIRTTDRVGKGLRSSPRDAMIADVTEPSARGRAYGYQRSMDHLGAAIGPLVATCFLLLLPGELRWLFLSTIVLSFVVIGLTAFGLREPPVHADTSKRPFTLTLKPFDRGFKTYLLALAIFTLGNSTDAFLLVRASEAGVAMVYLPLLWCLFHVVKSGGSAMTGRWIDTKGPRGFIVAGWLFYAVVYLGFGLSADTWQIWALFLSYGVFHALVEPAEKTLVANLVGVEHRGLAFGWFNFTIGVVTLPSSVLFGLLYEQYGALTAFGWGAGLSVVASLALLAVPSIAVSPRAD